jgi:phosphopantetheinyl transferase (holo-ACP synthase)
MTTLPPVGNDVVDLKEKGNRGKSRDDRFVGRVFTEEERGLIAIAERPDAMLWSFWAAKEAAYKLVSRDNPLVFSTPRRYPVSLDDRDGGRETSGLAGRVTTPRGGVAFRVIITDDYVHALAASTDKEIATLIYRVDWIDRAIDPSCDPSVFVREQVMKEIARSLDCPVGNLSIRMDMTGPGVPRLFLSEKPLEIEISLSHDGRFTAFAFTSLPS